MHQIVIKLRKKIDISIVMPCLNEEKTVGKCIRWAKEGLKKLGKLKTEIIVVDNGSSDNSREIILTNKVKIIDCYEKGYGRAYKKGLENAQGKYIVIADADSTYDLREIPKFIAKLNKGFDLVLGSRFHKALKARSMPFFNRVIGNPLLTSVINIFYRCRITDSQTGFRAFRLKAYRKMNLKGSGMDFASEMIIKAIAHKLKITEIPISYFPRRGKSKLSPFKDAAKIIIAILIYSPTTVLILPGVIAFIVGAIGTLVILPGPLYILGGKKYIDIHTMTVCIFLAIIGLHTVLVGIYTKLYTVKRLGIPGGALTYFLIRNITLQKLFIAGLFITLFSFFIIGDITLIWIRSGFSQLSREREFIFALGLGAIGAQLVFSSFLFEIMQRDS